jgi:hypothetical protein
MKSLVNAVKSSSRAELLNLIMEASAHIRKDRPSITRSVTSLLLRVTMCIDNRGGHFEVITS